MRCGNCKWRRSIPGDCHISCGKAFDTTGNPLAAVLMLLGGVGRTPLPGPTEPVDFGVKMKSWPGCGQWPACFDESIIIECEGWEEEDEQDINT